METFDYEEEVRFLDVGLPSIMYQQRAWSPGDGGTLHIETGIWRSSPEGTLAVSIALPRVSEISEGNVKGHRIRLATTSVRRATGGAGLVAVRREYDRRRDEINYRIFMATEGVKEVTLHLTGVLRRTSAT